MLSRRLSQKKYRWYFIVFLLHWTARAGAILSKSEYFCEGKKKILGFAGEEQTHVVSLLALKETAASDSTARASLIACVVRQQHGELVGDAFGLCAGQQIAVGLAK